MKVFIVLCGLISGLGLFFDLINPLNPFDWSVHLAFWMGFFGIFTGLVYIMTRKV